MLTLYNSYNQKMMSDWLAELKGYKKMKALISGSHRTLEYAVVRQEWSNIPSKIILKIHDPWK